MEEARPANVRSLLLSALILSSSASQALAYYHPEEGRWISRDPIGEDGGLHLYAFVFNEPVNRVDDTGLSPTARNDATIDRVRRWTQSQLADPDIRRRFPLASRFLEHWLSGAGGTVPLTASEIDMTVATPQGDSAMARLDAKLLAECRRRASAGESMDLTISFAGAPRRGGTGVQETFPMDTSDDAKYNLFLAFHNVYFDAQYSGKCCATASGMTFTGSAEYKIWDWYGFADRPWGAVPLPGAPNDAEMWQLQEYGEAAPFNVEGTKTYNPIAIPPGAAGGSTTPPPGAGGGRY